jgi:regulatory protein
MDDFEKFYLMAANFLSYRPRSEKEVRDKLGMKKVPAEILEKIIMTLKQQRYINDEQFAKEWILSRSKYRLKSKRIIKIELIKKGIAPEIIEKALNTAAEDEEVQMDDLGKAKKLAEGRISRYKHLPKNEIYQLNDLCDSQNDL